jgi:DNA-binding CsgD family transcriptional regulator
MLGHHEGALLIENEHAVSMTSELGFWNFSATTPSSPTPLVISGNYNGLRTFNWQNNHFIKGDSIPGFTESSRFVANDQQGNIWVSHPYHGIFKIFGYLTASQNVKIYGIKNGLPSDFNNYIYKIRNQIVAATEKGVYTYHRETDKFIPDPFFQNIIGNISVRVLKEDTEGNIWFIHEKFPAVIDLGTEKAKVIYLQELNNKLVSGFECIYPVDQNNVFLGGEKGFFHVNYEKYKKNAVSIPLRISAVRIYNQQDSILFGGYYASIQDKPVQLGTLIPDINYDWHNIHIDFTSITYGQDAGIQYSYRLVGLDDEWSNWSDKREKEYTNLPPGHYSFELKAKNNLGAASEIISYQFNILPPWYRTIWAYALYVLLITCLVSYLYYRQRKKFKRQKIAYEEEQQKMQYMHQLEMDKAESELISLRNEKLQSEIDYKNSELAMSAMHLVQKGELITKLKNELNTVMKSVDNEKAAVEIKKMIKVLGEDDKIDKDWDHFAQHFDKVHSDFLVLLKEKHPNLTANEMKLCSYLRMNLSTKEMAQLMNISVRGVEISRYRLRKKLGITTEVSIYDHLMRISGGIENE